jgi:hypothetical protein
MSWEAPTLAERQNPSQEKSPYGERLAARLRRRLYLQKAQVV